MERPRKMTSLPEAIFKRLNPSFLDEDVCTMEILKILHPHGPACPACGKAPSEHVLQSFLAGRRVQCPTCGKCFSWRTNTPLSGLHMDAQELALFAMLIGFGMTNRWIARALDYHIETIRILRNRIGGIIVHEE